MTIEEWVLLVILAPGYATIGWVLWRYPDLRHAISPQGLADRLHTWLLSLHAPVDWGEPGAPEAWCRTCCKPWPCDELARLEARKP